jgi:hypothetical protein
MADMYTTVNEDKAHAQQSIEGYLGNCECPYSNTRARGMCPNMPEEGMRNEKRHCLMELNNNIASLHQAS